MLYFAVLFASGCQLVDSPLAFVHGCKNYGIDWNSFMAPVGMFVVLLVPLTIVYWIARFFQGFFSLTHYVYTKISHKNKEIGNIEHP